jgi:hypothetical protein
MKRCAGACAMALVMAVPSLALAQGAEQQPAREFSAFRGTWTIDESAGRGHIGGLPVARTRVIATTPTELSISKDGHFAMRSRT